MILDYQLEVSSSQTLGNGSTTPASATASTNTLDLSSNVRLPEAFVAVHVSAKSGTTPNLVIDVYGDTASGFGTEKLVASRTIATGDLAANKVYYVALPPTAAYRYWRVKYTQNGNNDNQATVSTWFCDDDHQQISMQLAGGVPAV